MKHKSLYAIKYVASKTGVKAHNIRSWEERYGAIKPERTRTNRRLYSEEDVHRLRLLKTAVESGHNISSVANLSNRELFEFVQREQSGPAWAEAETAAEPPPRPRASDEMLQTTVELALSHVGRLDALALEAVLSDAAVAMPRQAFLQNVIVPLFKEIGALWRAGRMKIINEHMASVIVRSILWDMLRTVELSASAPRIVIAIPAGQWHEFGAIASALVASESGWQSFYFGPNLPSEEIVYAVKKVKAAALTLSVSHRLNQHKLILELKKIRRMVADDLPVFVGGNGAEVCLQANRDIRAIVVNDLEEFRHRLEDLN
jgi:DNA-binding transcriptional MerR regulator/methylmalonyl-CoA mutase cobalamin-binding subunit